MCGGASLKRSGKSEGGGAREGGEVLEALGDHYPQAHNRWGLSLGDRRRAARRGLWAGPRMWVDQAQLPSPPLVDAETQS